MSTPLEEQIEELLHVTRKSLVNTGVSLYPDLFCVKPSPLHHSLSDALVNSVKSTVLAFPREFGKSTFMWEGMSSWNILHQRYNYIMYIGATVTIAEDAMSNVKNTIKSHPLLMNIIEVVKDTKNQFFFKIGKRQFFYACYGAGQQLRGKRFDRFRPDLIILDDLETTEGVRSDDQRKKLRDWFWADVIPLGKEARFFFVGTMLHEDCLLARLIQNPPEEHKTGERWASFRYGVIDEDSGKPTWPEKYDESWIDLTRKKYIDNGMLYRFNTEYMNIAVDRKDRAFDPQQIRFYSPEQLKAAMNGGMDIITVVDPGIDANADHDPTVIWTSAMDSEGNMWVLNIVRERLIHPQILDHIVQEYRRWNPRQLYIEAVQAQQYLLQDLEHGTWPGGDIIPVEKIDGKQIRMGKLRIYGLQGLFQHRKVMVPASAPWWTDMCDEMVTFPRGKHDDILDCAAYAKMNHIEIGGYKLDVDKILNDISPTAF